MHFYLQEVEGKVAVGHQRLIKCKKEASLCAEGKGAAKSQQKVFELCPALEGAESIGCAVGALPRTAGVG